MQKVEKPGARARHTSRVDFVLLSKRSGGHASRQMLSRYSHIRMEAKRKALAEVDRQRAADKAQCETGRATAQAKRDGAPVSNVAQTASVQ